jgi:hypothetical protein
MPALLRSTIKRAVRLMPRLKFGVRPDADRFDWVFKCAWRQLEIHDTKQSSETEGSGVAGGCGIYMEGVVAGAESQVICQAWQWEALNEICRLV